MSARKLPRVRLVILLTLVATSSTMAAAAGEPLLIPCPRKVTMGEGDVTTFDRKLGISVEGNNLVAARRAAETFAADLSELGFDAAIVESSSITTARITLQLVEDRSAGPEAYRLSVDGGMSITAGAEPGLFWGTRTALQLLRKGPGVPVRRMSIQDEPEFGYRGCLVDVARQFHSIEFHRKMVKRLAAYKINMYHIHFSDDQSYTLPSERFPALPTPGRHYSKQELRDLVALAARYHVTIVPEIDMPGHASAMCAAVPDLVCRGKRPGAMICAGSDRAFAAMTTLVIEAMDLFPGRYFHIGADECTFAAWDGCSDCAAAIAREKLKDNEALYNWFINRMNRFVKSKGRKMVVWEGFKVGREPVVDKDILVEEFAVEYAMPGDLLNAGYELVNSACCPLYVVQHWATKATAPEHLAEWNALYFGGGHPSKRIGEMIRVSPSPRLKGVCMCSWENKERAEFPALFGIGEPLPGYGQPAPRIPLAAERAWSGSGVSADDLLSRAQRDIASEPIVSIREKAELCNYNSKIAIRTNGPGLGTLRLSLGFGAFAEKPQGQLALMKENGEIVHAARTQCEWRPWQISSDFQFPQGMVISQRAWVEEPFAHATVSVNGDSGGAKLLLEGSTTRMGKAFVSPMRTVLLEEIDPALKPCVLEIACSIAPDRVLLSSDGQEWAERDFTWGERPVAYRMIYDRPPHEMTLSAHLGSTSDFLAAREWEGARRRENDVKAAWIRAYDEDFPDIECPESRIRDLVQLCLYVNRSCALQPGGRLPYAFGVPTKYVYPMWWMWDSAFHAIPAAWMKDSSFAFGNLLTHTLFQSRNGCVMDAGGLFYGDTGDGKWIPPDYYDEAGKPCTGPCVTGIAVWDVYQKTGSIDFLKRVYPHLVLYERWLAKDKASGLDPDLIVYGSWYDVGWDDSKRWGKSWEGNLKHADIDWALPVVPVDANVFFMRLREALAGIAGLLGDSDRARIYAEKGKATGRAIDRLMWNEKSGFYFDILPSGRMLDVWTPAGFVPLMAGIPSEDRYRRMRAVLFDPKRFWSRYPLPTISLDDETFSTVMWSGGTWVNVNWQVVEGLFKYDTDAALQLVWRTIDMMTKDGHPVCSEYFGPQDGEPKGGHDYGWTTLVVDMVLRRIFGINPKGDTVELDPHLPAQWPEARIRNVFVLGTQLDIHYMRLGGTVKAKIRNSGGKGITLTSATTPTLLQPGAEVTIEIVKK